MKKTHKYTSDQKLAWWGYGEWVEEPDEVIWEYRGYSCKIRRIVYKGAQELVFGGHLCGYIQVPKNHPWHEKDRDEIDAEMHGGITYAAIEEAGNFWIGFDCAHYGDTTPSSARFEFMLEKIDPSYARLKKMQRDHRQFLGVPGPVETYKNVDFCIKECEKLVGQAIAAAAGVGTT